MAFHLSMPNSASHSSLCHASTFQERHCVEVFVYLPIQHLNGSFVLFMQVVCASGPFVQMLCKWTSCSIGMGPFVQLHKWSACAFVQMVHFRKCTRGSTNFSKAKVGGDVELSLTWPKSFLQRPTLPLGIFLAPEAHIMLYVCPLCSG